MFCSFFIKTGLFRLQNPGSFNFFLFCSGSVNFFHGNQRLCEHGDLVIMNFNCAAGCYKSIFRAISRNVLHDSGNNSRYKGSMIVQNLEAADNVIAQGDAANALGEGFADSLDVGGF